MDNELNYDTIPEETKKQIAEDTYIKFLEERVKKASSFQTMATYVICLGAYLKIKYDIK